MILLKVLIVMSCGFIAFQDFKERAVVWIAFPVVAILLMALHLYNSLWEVFLHFAAINCLLVMAIVGIAFLYTRLIAKRKFLNTSFGLGDLLFFFALALGFPTFTFVIIFVSSLLFSLLFVQLNPFSKVDQTIPLAGLMSLFLIAVILASFFPGVPSLYII